MGWGEPAHSRKTANYDLSRILAGFLDASMGVSGEGSTMGGNSQRLRSRIRMTGQGGGDGGECRRGPAARQVGADWRPDGLDGLERGHPLFLH